MLRSKLKPIFATFLLVALTSGLYAQNVGCNDIEDCPVYSTSLSPSIEWKDEYWYPTDINGNSIDQHESDEDWHFDLLEYHVNGVPSGYIAVGFVGVNGFSSYTLNDENDDPIDCYKKEIVDLQLEVCHGFQSEERRKHLHRQSVVFYDYNGNVQKQLLYNQGDIFACAQDANGDIYLVGTSQNPTNITECEEIDFADEQHHGNVPIYYNPTSTIQNEFSTSSILDCTISGEFVTKFNVLKIDVDGDVIWNNYYGIEEDVNDIYEAKGIGHALVIDGSQIIAGGYAEDISGSVQERKFIVAIDKSNGHVNWKGDIEPSQSGQIFGISKQGNDFVIVGADNLVSGMNNPEHRNAFISKHSNSGSASFLTPTFKKTPSDIPSSVLQAENFPTIDPNIQQKSNCAIFVNNRIYWMIMVNGDPEWTAANFEGRGAVVEMDLNGNFLEVDDIGWVRAFDMMISGVPTDDGGFAIVTSKQSPDYYGTPNGVQLNEPLDENDPNGPTIEDCINQLSTPYCIIHEDIVTEDTKLFQFMSTCSYVRKYDSNFNFEWDKIWDSTNNAPRECFPYNLKQQECVYQIIQSSEDGGLVLVGNTSDNFDDSYMVKLSPDCALADFVGGATGPDLITAYDDAGIYEINGNVVWDTPKKVLAQVHIMDGATLTIENTTIEFAGMGEKRPGLYVEQNGLLIVENAELTSMGGCEDFWHGIEVWGDINQHQYAYNGNNYYQGRAFIRDNSIIANARTGIRNWQPHNWNARGGIIKVDESQFPNCRRAIEFMAYQNFSPTNPSILRQDQSQITSSVFEVDDNYFRDMNEEIPLARITLSGTDRVRIEGCVFKNLTQNVDYSESLSLAIYSHDANYLVKEHCNDPFPSQSGCEDETNNTFIGWHKAIEALETESGAGRPILVRNSVFSENMIGVELSEVSHSEVYWNEFHLGGHSKDYDDDLSEIHSNLAHLGIYSKSTTAFSIEENEFTKQTGATNYTHGILVYNSGGNSNRLYNNSFENLQVGQNGWQVNRNIGAIGKIQPGDIGLQFICSDNSGNTIDHEMSREIGDSQIEYLNSGLRRDQGNLAPSLPTGNELSTPNASPVIFTHFSIYSDHNDYTYLAQSGQEPLTSEIGPGTMNVYLALSGSNSCPTTYANGGPSGGVKDQLNGIIGDLQGMEYTYSQLIDNGNTNQTLNEIALTWPEDAWDLRDELMARSPYNSEEVLIAAAKKEIMPHAMLLEVLIANPDALRSGAVIKAVELELIDPMPEYMVDLLHVAKDEKTLRSSMESTMSNLYAQASVYQKRGVSQSAFYLEEDDRPDSTLYYLSKTYSLGSNYNTAFTQAYRGDYNSAVNLLDSTLTNYNLETFEKSECRSMIDLLYLLESVKTSGRTIGNMTDEQIVSMRAIAEKSGAGGAAIKAQNALCFHYSICYDSEGSPKSNTTTPRQSQVYDQASIIDRINNSTVFPSPAKDFATIKYNLLRSKENTMLRIFDTTGRIVYQETLGEGYQGQVLVDTREFANGLYIIEISQGQESVETNKFMITH